MDYSDYEFLKVEKADRVATLTLNRPDILNAVNSRMHHEIEQIWLIWRRIVTSMRSCLPAPGGPFVPVATSKGWRPEAGWRWTGRRSFQSWSDYGGEWPADCRKYARR